MCMYDCWSVQCTVFEVRNFQFKAINEIKQRTLTYSVYIGIVYVYIYSVFVYCLRFWATPQHSIQQIKHSYTENVYESMAKKYVLKIAIKVRSRINCESIEHCREWYTQFMLYIFIWSCDRKLYGSWTITVQVQ